MTMNGMEKFQPRRSSRRVWLFIAVFGAFVPIGLVILFTTGEIAGLLIAAFGLLPVLFFIYKIRAPGAYYAVGPEGVELKHGRSRRTIPLGSIRGAAVLTEQQGEDALNHYLEPAIQSEKGLDLKGWYRANTVYGNFIRFCTVPIVQQTTTSGSSLNIIKFRNLTSGEFVLLKLDSGEEFLLSPEDSRGFFRDLSARVPLEDTSPVSSCVHTDRENWKVKARKRIRWIYLYAAGTFLVIASIVAVKFVIPAVGSGSEVDGLNTGPAAGSTAAQTSEVPAVQSPDAAAASGWVDGDTFRLVISMTAELNTEDPGKRRDELIMAVAEAYKISLISRIIDMYVSDSGRTPTDEQHGALEAAVEQEITGIEPEVVASTFNQDNTAMQAVIDVRAPALRSSIEGRFDEVLK